MAQVVERPELKPRYCRKKKKKKSQLYSRFYTEVNKISSESVGGLMVKTPKDQGMRACPI
jgi:hypothetical protein